MKEEKQGFVIGVDGGGTKTVAALANLKGRILKISKSGPSNLRNLGIKKAIENIAKAIKEVLGKEKIVSTFIGLPALEEEFRLKKEEIKKEILNHKEISQIFKGRIKIGSDQLVAFRSAAKGDGVLLIVGTGMVVHGWHGKKEVKVGGWGWLADEGSGFWIGQKTFQAIFKDLDGRGPKTKITKIIFRKWRLENKEEILEKIYSGNLIKNISLISETVEEATKEGDEIAKLILKEASQELAKAAILVIKKLTPPLARQRAGFPLVLVGGVLKSKYVLEELKKEIRKIAPKVEFIRPKVDPVMGAVKLAIEQLNPVRNGGAF